MKAQDGRARYNNFQNSAFPRWKLFIEKFSPHWQIFAAQTVKVVGAIFGFFKFAEEITQFCTKWSPRRQPCGLSK